MVGVIVGAGASVAGSAGGDSALGLCRIGSSLARSAVIASNLWIPTHMSSDRR